MACWRCLTQTMLDNECIVRGFRCSTECKDRYDAVVAEIGSPTTPAVRRSYDSPVPRLAVGRLTGLAGRALSRVKTRAAHPRQEHRCGFVLARFIEAAQGSGRRRRRLFCGSVSVAFAWFRVALSRVKAPRRQKPSGSSLEAYPALQRRAPMIGASSAGAR